MLIIRAITHRRGETVAKINFEGATFKNSFAGKRVTLADGVHNYHTDVIAMLKEQGHKVEE